MLCGPQPNPQLSHCLGGADGSDAVHGVGSDAMRTAGVASRWWSKGGGFGRRFFFLGGDKGVNGDVLFGHRDDII